MAARRLVVLLAVVLLGLVVPGAAGASQIVTLNASFSPYRLGRSTTISLGFNVTSTTDSVPSPVIDVKIDLPAGMGLGTTDLGEETCNPEALLILGPNGCSPNSRMGLGNATVEVPTKTDPPTFDAGVIVYMGKPVEHHTTMLIYAETVTPVYGQYLFPSELLPATGAYGAQLNTAMPLIPTWPEGPPAAIVHLETTLGPSHLIYYTHRHGKLVSYRPEGMAVPEHCPRGGFPFRAIYHFQDGSSTSATTVVPCPRISQKHKSGHRAAVGARRRR